ncbi:nuclear transport factor 2 family protein [Kribbella qitaiheensis]|uniref:Nuclear transport factor 2 family protein n=1 Tax=Kribbella qitaiheensis TaxID=1544730 RepID=A0A7G6WXB5_9ACTN|nr:nuclear transport factor 2 family protein [Kribbella qitaiheensis]QNE18630.1 nuclear transport factor 2 family protein [Kribbella qitaiheensis]
MTVRAELVEFWREYERRTNGHLVGPWGELLAEDAVYWFTTGSFVGRAAVMEAVEHNFRVIEDEVYRISDVEWVAAAEDSAVVRYRFSWVGVQDGQEISGAGRGTNVMVRRDGRWLMLHEHLSV